MHDTIKAAAAYFFEAACLWEDEDLDPEDAKAVLQRAFTSSDCDLFAEVVSGITGWQAVTLRWEHPDLGLAHHSVLTHPNGALVDVTGFVTEDDLRARYRIPREDKVMYGHVLAGDIDEDGAELLTAALPHLPDHPCAAEFSEALARRRRLFDDFMTSWGDYVIGQSGEPFTEFEYFQLRDSLTGPGTMRLYRGMRVPEERLPALSGRCLSGDLGVTWTASRNVAIRYAAIPGDGKTTGMPVVVSAEVAFESFCLDETIANFMAAGESEVTIRADSHIDVTGCEVMPNEEMSPAPTIR